MTVTKKIQEFIVCPICRKKMELVSDEGNTENYFICTKKHKFQILNNIPRLIPNIQELESQTKDSFSFKWKHFSEISYGPDLISDKRDWYLERYGWGDRAKFEEFIRDKRFILDAGCGLGRDSAWFSELCPSGNIFAVDISEAIDVAHQKYSNNENIFFVQGDIAQLSFPDNFFDYISCDQVIHHTPKPLETFQHLVSKLKSGGQIAVYVYKKKAPIREFCDDYIREKTTDMDVDEAMEFSKSITLLGKALSELNTEFEVPEDIPILEIKKGQYNIQRFFYWNILKCYWNDKYGQDHSIAVNFDWYHPKYAYRYSLEEFRGWFEASGIKIDNINVADSGISMIGEKK